MPISTECPECGRRLKAPDSAAGRRARCPDCGAAVPIPEPVYDAEDVFDASDLDEYGADGADEEGYGLAPPARPPAAQTGDRHPCPMCGEMILTTAVKCRYCGEVLDESAAGDLGRRIERGAKGLLREKQDKETALVLFITGLVGCLSPVCAIYGLVFLARRSYEFPRKGLAIAGTILHCFWVAILVLVILSGGFQ